jgi:hypothetical protein
MLVLYKVDSFHYYHNCKLIVVYIDVVVVDKLVDFENDCLNSEIDQVVL